MSPQTMTEKDMYVAGFDREYQTTRRVLHAYPAAKSELKPSEKSQTARALAWTLAMSQMVIDPIVAGELIASAFPPAPAWADVLATFDQAHQGAMAKLGALTDAQFNETIRMSVGPKQVGDVRRGDALWMMLMDTVHHRGQLSVYTRMADAVLPPIYGPTLEQPWS